MERVKIEGRLHPAVVEALAKLQEHYTLTDACVEQVIQIIETMPPRCALSEGVNISNSLPSATNVCCAVLCCAVLCCAVL